MVYAVTMGYWELVITHVTVPVLRREFSSGGFMESAVVSQVRHSFAPPVTRSPRHL